MQKAKSKEFVSENVLLYLYILLMLAVLFLRNALSIDIPVLSLLVITAVFAIFASQTNLLAIAMCCIPMGAGFQVKYALLICIVIYIIKNFRTIKFNTVSIIVAIMMVWELLHGFGSKFSIVECFRCFAELLFLAVVTATMNMKDTNYKQVFRALSLSVVGVCLIMLFIQLQKHHFNLTALISREAASFRFGGANTDAANFGLNFNPNGLGYICVLSVLGMLVLAYRGEHKLSDLILLALSALFSLMTLSRAAIICLLFVMLCYVIFQKGKADRKAFGLAFVVLALAFVLINIAPSIVSNIASRFRAHDITNGRVDLAIFYSEHIFSSPEYCLFGIGLQDRAEKISNIYKISINVSHNGFQEIWVVWGIIGVILFVLLLVAIIKQSSSYSGKRCPFAYTPLLLMLLFTSSGQLISSSSDLLSLSFIYMVLSMPWSVNAKMKLTNGSAD